MKSSVINHAFLHSLPIEIWIDDELIGSGNIVQHTLRTVTLDDGQNYYKHMFEFRLQQPAP